MNEFEVLTVRDLDFLDDRNRPVKGMQIWVIQQSNDPAWNGWEVSKIWIPDGSHLETTAAALKRGDHIGVIFDRRGKPFSMELLSA